MLINNLFRILKSYKFFLPTIVFFELVYLVKRYKGNKFNLLNDNEKTDNIPCPYYFLFKIKKALRSIDFKSFVDLGSGSGRVIDFFNKSFPDKKLFGIEYFNTQYEYSKKIFERSKNIKIIQGDFSKIDFFQYNIDCYFLNDPFKNNLDFTKFIEKVIDYNIRKKIMFIFINCNKEKIKNFRKIKCIENFYINNSSGYSIYSLN